MRSTPHDMSAWRTGLVAWFALIVGLSADAISWADESQTMTVGVSGSLRPIADVALGQEEKQTELASPAGPDGEELTRKIGGPRALSLSLVLDGYDQRLPGSPFFTLRSAATKIRSSESIAALQELGFGLISVGRVLNVPRKESGRTFPRAVLDLRLGYTNVENLDPITFIESAELTSHVRDTDGTELPSPPNQVVEISAS